MENTIKTIEKPKKDLFRTASLVLLAIITLPILFGAVSSLAFSDPKGQYAEKLKLDEMTYKANLDALGRARCSLAATKLLAYSSDALELSSDEVKRLSELKNTTCQNEGPKG